MHALAAAFGTDKHKHGFTLYDPSLLERFRPLAFDLLEIGVLGGSSLRLWRAWFPRARVFGAGLQQKQTVQSDDGIMILGADQHRLADVRMQCAIERAQPTYAYKTLEPSSRVRLCDPKPLDVAPLSVATGDAL